MLRSSPITKENNSNIKAKYEVGKLKFESPSNLNFTWAIANYLSLPQQQDWCFVSHSINFLNAKWRLYIFPNGCTPNNHSGWIGITLRKEYSFTQSHHISFKVSISRKDGKEYVSKTFKKDFVGNETFGGMHLMQQRQLLENEADILQNGNLTLICVLKSENEENSLTDAQEADARTGEAEMYLDRTEHEGSDDKEDVPDLKGIKILLENFKNLFLSGENSDVIINVRDQEFKAHRTILGARSRVFSAMFSHDTIEKNTGDIEITDCQPGVFYEFLRYLYTGQVEEVPDDQVLELYLLLINTTVKI